MALQNAQQIAELLPFWINGSLSADEAAEVAAAVAADPALADETAFLRALRARMQAEPPGYSPGEIGLARLKRTLAVETAPRRVSLATAAAVALIAAGLGFAAQTLLRPAPVEYIQASGDTDSAALLVAFQPTAPAQAISQALLAEGLTILDGPSALGLYRLAPMDAPGTDLAALAERLQARADVFEVVDLAE